MRVCMIISLHSPKDDRIFFKEAISLKKRGFEVSILCLTDENGQIKDMSGNVLNLENQSKIESEGIQIIGVKKQSGFFQNILHKLGKGKCWNEFIEKAKEIMHNIAVSSDNVCTDPDPRVRFRTFGESGLNLQLLAWIDKPEIRGSVIDELSTNIYNAFNEDKIEIPFPQRTVHIKKTDI